MALLIDVVTHSVTGVTNELFEIIEKLPKEKQQRIINAVGAGADAVDYKLISICHRGDIVVSQDYGVAAMALGKGLTRSSGPWI